MAKVGSYRWEGEVARRDADEAAALAEIDEALSEDPTEDEIADLLDFLDEIESIF